MNVPKHRYRGKIYSYSQLSALSGIKISTIKSRINVLGWTVRKALKKHSYPLWSKREPILYDTWIRIRQRCNNPNGSDYHHYGGRGITVSKRWMKFENFLADMKPSHIKGLEIDRINNNKGYNKRNCRWATRTQQVNNTRVTHLISFKGKTLSIAQWARALGIPRCRIKDRINRLHWPPHKALIAPKRTNQYV